jgi:hypothetical protein
MLVCMSVRVQNWISAYFVAMLLLARNLMENLFTDENLFAIGYLLFAFSMLVTWYTVC